MKKVLISVLLVLLTLCLFVSCKEVEPKNELKGITITFIRDSGISDSGKSGTLNIDTPTTWTNLNGETVVINSHQYTISIDGSNHMKLQEDTGATYFFSSDTGWNFINNSDVINTNITVYIRYCPA